MRVRRLLPFFMAILLLPSLAFAEVIVRVPGIRVTTGPPPLRTEVQTVRPSPGHVWIAGHYAWRGGHHEWVAGYWGVAPGPGYVYEPARWVNDAGFNNVKLFETVIKPLHNVPAPSHFTF